VATHRYANEHGGWGESLVTHNDKWIETQSQWDQNSRTTEFRTSEGVSGQMERQQVGDITTRSGEFQRGDQSLSTRSARGEQGTVIGAQTGSGQSVAVGRSADGDLYAGKDGQVYKRGDDGWYQQEDGNWNKVEVPDDRAAQIDQKRSTAADRKETSSQDRTTDNRLSNRSTDSQRQSALNRGSFADSYGNPGDRSTRSFDSSRSQGTFDASRRSELNRSQQARTNGYQRYNNRSSASSRPQGGRRGGGRRR
jgi:hypothetical protein